MSYAIGIGAFVIFLSGFGSALALVRWLKQDDWYAENYRRLGLWPPL